MNQTQTKRRSAWKIMGQLIGLIKPLIHIMAAAILLGTIGYLCAIFLTILAGGALLKDLEGVDAGRFSGISIRQLFLLMGSLAVLRGVLHYIEQYCNHFIAFKLLAIIRHKVFATLKCLCPAKLEGRDKGNLISVITTDIELLEVFYAHTISPIAITFLTSLIMVFFIGSYHVEAGLLAVVIPLWNGKRGGDKGMAFRNGFGELNSFVLDSLRGLDETIQYNQGKARQKELDERSVKLASFQKDLSKMEGSQRSITNFSILGFSLVMLLLTMALYHQGEIGFDAMLICTVAMMGSFGPVVALSSLSNNLNQTLASGERVLSILEETPMVEEIPVRSEGEKLAFAGATAENVSFAYEEEEILKNCSVNIEKGKIIGIHGASGSGKSTLLRLFMRFWDVQKGSITISGKDVRTIPTPVLRDTESFVMQETQLFHDSIANNIAIGKENASREEIIEAAKKASVHEFISTLPKGYDTEVGELGDTLSGGEKQRIGIARAFLHDAPFLLMDEPTSNLDSLNEGIILKSLIEEGKMRTVLLVSHRKSTMKVADVVFHMDPSVRKTRT